jgi:nucleoid-associated protein YgaU
MASLQQRRFSLRLVGGLLSLLTMLLAGCAAKSPASPPGPSAEVVRQQLAALEACTQRSQQVTQAALAAGARPQELAPMTEGIAEAQAALDSAHQLLAAGKNQEAMAQATQALQACTEHEAKAVQVRDAALAAQREQVAAQLAQVSPCLDEARQAVLGAEAAGAEAPEVAPANEALVRAEAALQEAQTLLQQGETAQAVERLKAAEADCRTAQEIGAQAKMAAARAPSKPSDYTVMRGDTLWGISGSQPIYANPFLWPMIYKANRDQIRDPDLIYPQQVFAIPRDIPEEEQQVAVRRARQRGKWQMADGPDHYVLEGVRE